MHLPFALTRAGLETIAFEEIGIAIFGRKTSSLRNTLMVDNKSEIDRDEEAASQPSRCSESTTNWEPSALPWMVLGGLLGSGILFFDVAVSFQLLWTTALLAPALWLGVWVAERNCAPWVAFQMRAVAIVVLFVLLPQHFAATSVLSNCLVVLSVCLITLGLTSALARLVPKGGASRQ